MFVGVIHTYEVKNVCKSKKLIVKTWLIQVHNGVFPIKWRVEKGNSPQKKKYYIY